MSELTELYVLFALIYLFECGEVVPRRAVGLVSKWGRWRVRKPFVPNASWGRGLLFGEPWPPLTSALVTEPLPLVVGPDGVTYGGVFVPWPEVKRVVAVGPRLEIDGSVAATLATRRGAIALADALVGLPALGRAAREARLRTWLDARFDGGAVTARLPILRRETRALRIVANALWAGLFLGVPLVLFAPVGPLALLVLVSTLAAWIAGAWLFERGLRRSRWLTRELRPEVAKRIVAVSSPVATIRAADHLARELCGDIDPIAAAAALLAPEELGAAARTGLCDLRHREAEPGPPGSEADAGWWRGEMLARLERTLRAHGVDPDALMAPPAPNDPGVVAWCPRCREQYRGEGGVPPTACANTDCRGITLAPFGTGGQSRPFSVANSAAPAREV